MWLHLFKLNKLQKKTNTYTHTHINIYVYIYIYWWRGMGKEGASCGGGGDTLAVSNMLLCIYF